MPQNTGSDPRRLIGFEFERTESSLPSIVPKEDEIGLPIGSYNNWVFNSYADFKTEHDLIRTYREMALHSEVETAIDDIIDEAFVYDENFSIVSLNMDVLPVANNIKRKIEEEFDNILSMMDFSHNAYEIFKRWYVDGRLYYHVIIDEKNPRKGIQELRPVDATNLKYVREPKRNLNKTQMKNLYVETDEYYIFNPYGIGYTGAGGTNIRMTKDSILACYSGEQDRNRKLILSYLHKAIKPFNNLKALEDSVVIYTLARAPERRIFYIDVGSLPKIKAEQYLRDQMNRYRTRVEYDITSGAIKNSKNYTAMLEDFWIPRREGNKATEISTLPSTQLNGGMDNVEYFRKKLYKALNVPISRLEPSQGFQLGRSSEITRDEVKFQKFLTRLRMQFSNIFREALKKQLILTGVCSVDDWKEINKDIHFIFKTESFFEDLTSMEIFKEKAAVIQGVGDLIGNYFSKNYIMTNVCRFSKDELDQIEKEIKKEIKNGEIPNPNAPEDGEESGFDGEGKGQSDAFNANANNASADNLFPASPVPTRNPNADIED